MGPLLGIVIGVHLLAPCFWKKLLLTVGPFTRVKLFASLNSKPVNSKRSHTITKRAEQAIAGSRLKQAKGASVKFEGIRLIRKILHDPTYRMPWKLW